jgi:Yip1 domain
VNAVRRVVAVLADPATVWPRIEKENGDATYLLVSCVALFALIPATAGFVGGSVIGVIVPGAGTVRIPVGAGLLAAIFGYAAAFVQVLLVALSIDMLAPWFGASPSFAAALKLAAHSFIPVWLAGIFLLLPGLWFLELAGVYGAVILANGLPALMRAPKQRSLAYAAVIVVLAAALIFVTAALQRALFGAAGR